MENTTNKSLMGIIVLLFTILSFVGGLYLGNKEYNRPSDSENILIRIPLTRGDLEKQYLLNKAQGQILEQMLKWDMYKGEKK